MARAVGTVAGAAVIVTAVVTAPQIASSLLPGGNGSDNVAIGSHSPNPTAQRSRPSPAGTILPSAGPTPKPGTGLSDTGNPAPAGFRPTSVTFIDQATGAALGQAGPPCPRTSCTMVAGTTNYGASWFGASTIPVGPPNGSRGVSQIRFLDSANGWAFGPQLLATHDGGRTWREPPGLPPGRVVDLSTVGGRAYAVLALFCTGTGQDYASGCRGFSVISAAAGSDHWGVVPGAGSASGPVSPGSLQIDGQRGYLMAGRLLVTGSVTGGPWNAVPNASPTEPSCLSGAQGAIPRRGPALIAPDGTSLYLACDGPSSATRPGPLTLYVTGDGGRSWRALGIIRARGTATSLAVAPAGAIVLATTTGIYYSPDGKTWHQASLTGHPPDGGYTFVGMTTSLNGVAVPADSGLHELFVTRDGGHSWRRSVIR